MGGRGGGSYINWYIHRLASLAPDDGQAYLKNQLAMTVGKRESDGGYAAGLAAATAEPAKVSDPGANPEAQKEAKAQPATYVVAQGETLSEIARRFNVSEQAIVAASGLANANMLRVGQELKIPSGGSAAGSALVVHKVVKGENIASIAAAYGVDTEVIIAYRPNGLINPNFLVVGKEIVIPGARAGASAVEQPKLPATPPKPAPVRAGGSGFSWPTIGPIFTYFGEDGHEGIDISPPYGTPVYAAGDGVVVEEVKLGWSYGWYVLVDHGDGFRTRYGHLGQFAVSPGDRITRGQLIGLVGTTGRSTGPHLHFEVIKNGVPVNPLDYLP
ncbi:MAG: M23 family metallopeptidase [Chloroflexi bacterium]|nr:M23 family metallopeptidase [Chloroflexota bacterium]